MKARLCFVGVLLLLSGCTTVNRQDNTALLIQHSEFRAAVRAAPNFVNECLLTITRLEEELEVASGRK